MFTYQSGIFLMYKILSIKTYLLLASLVLLLLPNLLFLIGWFRPFIAIPFCCLLTFSVLVIWHKSKTTYLPTSSALICSRGDIIKLIVCIIGALIITETISFHGHFYQAADFHVRNAIYQSLIDKPWPLYNAKDEYFVYYHAFWLPPALISKFIGHIISPATILFAWTYLYLAISILLLFCRIRGHILTFCAILITLGTIAPDCFHIFANLYEPSSEWLFKHGLYRYNMWYVPFWQCFTDIFHVTISGFLCLSVLFSGLLPKRYWCIPAALIVQAALLYAGTLFLWLCCVILKDYKTLKDTLKSPHTWVSAMFVLLVLLYFSCLMSRSSNNGAHFVWATEDEHLAYALTVRAIFLSVFLIIPLNFIVEKRMRNNFTFLGGSIAAAVIPFLWVGMNNNELLFKGSTVVYFLFAWVLSVQWKYSTQRRKFFIAMFLTLTSAHTIHQMHYRKIFYDYGWSQEIVERHIFDCYHGSIDNMSGYINSQFFAENRFPEILLSNAEHTGRKSE